MRNACFKRIFCALLALMLLVECLPVLSLAETIGGGVEIPVKQDTSTYKNSQRNQEKITAEISVSKDIVEIGQPLTIEYQLVGGSGIFNDVTVQVLFFSNCSALSYDVGGRSKYFTTANGSWTIVPTEGNEMTIQIYGHDSNGQYFYIDGPSTSIMQNPNYTVNVILDRKVVNIQDTIIGQYSISNCSSFSGTIYALVVTKDENGWAENITKVDVAPISSTSGEIEFTPLFGDECHFIISGSTESSEAIYYESASFSIVGSEIIDPIKVIFSSSTNNPQIGHEFTLSFLLEGGSGEYPEVTIQALFPYTSGLCVGGLDKSFSTASGSWTFIPSEGTAISVQIYGYDSDGRYFYLNGPNVPLSPNLDKVINVTLPSTANIGEPCAVSYSVENCVSFSGSAYITVKKSDPYVNYSDRINPVVLTVEKGTFYYTPLFGEELYVTIEGRTGDGAIVYVETESIPIKAAKICPATGSEHVVVVDQAIAPTCTSGGLSEGKRCSACGGILAEQKSIPAKGHSPTKVKTKPATLTADGCKSYYQCNVCGKMFTDSACTNETSKDKRVIPAVGKVKLSDTSYSYDGKVKRPAVGVYDANGTKLKKDTDYTVTYAKGRKSVGKYNVTVKGIGSYSFKTTLTFKINPPKSAVYTPKAQSKGFTAKWVKKTSQVTGYQLQYALSSDFSDAKTVTIKDNTTVSKTVKGLKSKKTYYVRIRTYKVVGSSKFYSAWSSAKSVKTK